MKTIEGCAVLAAMLIASAGVQQAQTYDAATSGAPPILVTVREYIQAGAEGAHTRLENDYAGVLEAGKGEQYYLGMGALTGAPRAVFLSGYSSMDEMAAVHGRDYERLGEKLSRIDEAHSETVTDVDTAIWRLRPDLSSAGTVNMAEMRYAELVQVHVKLGHGADFDAISQHIKEGWAKADPSFQYSVYEQNFGPATDDAYLVVIGMKSLGEVDKHHAMIGDYRTALGDETHKKMLGMERDAYDTVETNLLVFAPAMSHLPEGWTKYDTAYWKPKPIVPVAAKRTAPAAKSPAAKAPAAK